MKFTVKCTRRILSLKILWLCFAVILVLPASVSADVQTLSPDSLTKIHFEQKLGAQVSSDLEFFDEQGKLVRLGDYFGKKPVILVLGYYRCPMLCSFVLNGMIGSLQDLKWSVGNQFDVIDVSIDPQETPALAAAKKQSYVKRYGRSESAKGWHFLTGTEPAIRRLAGEVGYGYAYDAAVKQYAHPSGLIILNSKGEVSQYLSGVVYSTQQLNAALVAAAAHKVGTPVADFFLLCFHYSPVTGKYGWLVMVLVRACGLLTFILLARFIFMAARSKTPAVNPTKTG